MKFTEAERFWAKVEVDPCGCWLWTAYCTKGGYGVFGVGGKRTMLAHRWAFKFFGGVIPAGYDLDHVKARGCVHRHCVNPAHLEAVTHRVNVLRGDTFQARNAVQTHCPTGHAYAGNNVYVDKRGCRHCRACRRQPRKVTT